MLQGYTVQHREYIYSQCFIITINELITFKICESLCTPEVYNIVYQLLLNKTKKIKYSSAINLTTVQFTSLIKQPSWKKQKITLMILTPRLGTANPSSFLFSILQKESSLVSQIWPCLGGT